MMIVLAPTLALAAALLAGGGQQSDPGLQKRPPGAPQDQTVKVTLEGGKTVIPDDASGLYRYADRQGLFGEGLQINQQFGEVTGYFSVAAEGKNHGLLTYFLSEVTGGNAEGHFTFTTRQVHSIWYSFDGKIFRGTAATPSQDGYYMLTGTLTVHDDTQHTTQNKNISLKLTGTH